MKPLLVTCGMGIGPEVTFKALAAYQPSLPVVLLGREEELKSSGIPRTFQLIGAEKPSCFWMTDQQEPVEVAAIRVATQQCLAGNALGMVTGPINKMALRKQGFGFQGHTDFLGHLCGADPVMAFVGGELRVALVTTHIPLMSVAQQLTKERIVHVVQVAAHALQRDLGISHPRFGVCGLNPHAGEQGMLGGEEQDVIDPACQELRRQGFQIEGAISAETAFLLARQKRIDMVVAMYHDQGLAPLKAVDFGRSVNWSIGLPILRTSVDHGTADQLVGKNQADPSSMIAALRLAEQILTYRQAGHKGEHP